jgi:hypothetical protein
METSMSKTSHATAILVIHGIGEQCPFQTLECFTSTFWSELSKIIGIKHLTGQNKAKAREGWTQNYISLSTDTDKFSSIDIYEYYWAYRPQGKITFNGILKWLVKTSAGAGNFYKEYFKKYPDKLKEYKNAAPDMFNGDEFIKYGYLKYIGWTVRILRILFTFIPEKVASFISPPLKWFEKKAIDYLGDVAIYTVTDMKSPLFTTRTEILYGAANEIQILMEDNHYDKIIIVGHSLGSVIAYDAINRVNHALNLGTIPVQFAKKLIGLVTFGSPLDKVAFFFNEQTNDSEELRRQILAHYHSFRAFPINKSTMKHKLSEPFAQLLTNLYWINYWHKMDKVSGPLDFYMVDKNREVLKEEEHYNEPWTVLTAHNNYWHHGEMYAEILDLFFK